MTENGQRDTGQTYHCRRCRDTGKESTPFGSVSCIDCVPAPRTIPVRPAPPVTYPLPCERCGSRVKGSRTNGMCPLCLKLHGATPPEPRPCARPARVTVKGEGTIVGSALIHRDIRLIEVWDDGAEANAAEDRWLTAREALQREQARYDVGFGTRQWLEDAKAEVEAARAAFDVATMTSSRVFPLGRLMGLRWMREHGEGGEF
jgi:hypothetical protein